MNRDYFIQQLHDFKNGARQSADARKPNTPIMAGFGVQMTEEEIRQSADYFSSIPWTPWIEVVESDTAPKTRPSGGMWLRLEGADAGTEPLGRRIIETPAERLRAGVGSLEPEPHAARRTRLRRGVGLHDFYPRRPWNRAEVVR